MRRFAPLPVVVALALLAACSSSSGKVVEPPSLTTTTVPAVASSGCRTSAPIVVGEEHVTITSSGRDRMFIRHVPAAYVATKPMPLVVDLHGYSEGADIHVKLSGLGAFGDTHGFLTLTPQGEGDPARWITTVKSDDMTFMGDLLDEAERTLCVDLAREFVTGLSNGAFMASAVGCALADRVAAIAPVAGVREIDGCAPARSIPVVAFHGTADQFVTYDGGFGSAAADLPAPDGSGRTLGETDSFRNAPKGKSIPQIIAAWAKRDGCTGIPAQSKPAVDTTLFTYHCPPNIDVELYRITDGGHAWPGSPVSAAVAGIVGRTTMLISANDIIWRFFQDHPLRRKGS
jgi:polyhydroxybutyrate depolymerase